MNVSSPRAGLRAVMVLLLWLSGGATAVAAPPPAVEDFIAEMVRKHGLDRDWLETWLGRARKQDDVVRLIKRPAEAFPWHRYRKLFLGAERVRAGQAFWREHSEQFQLNQQRYGVPSQIVAAIIGVETTYGRNTGRHRVLDVLFTLAFHYPPRQKFFRGELEHFLLLVRELEWPPDRPKGSYAGAMGLPQFMPSSYRRYAVDFWEDGRADIWNDPADAMASVAHYLQQHGWRRGAPVVLPLDLEEPQARALSAWFKAQPRERPSLGAARARGLPLPPEGASLEDELLVMLVELDLEEGKAYWLGLPNFYVITRYNRSRLYAMAVWRLAEAIRLLHEREGGS